MSNFKDRKKAFIDALAALEKQYEVRLESEKETIVDTRVPQLDTQRLGEIGAQPHGVTTSEVRALVRELEERRAFAEVSVRVVGE